MRFFNSANFFIFPNVSQFEVNDKWYVSAEKNIQSYGNKKEWV